MKEKVVPVVKKRRGPKVQEIVESPTNWPPLLQTKLKEKLIKYEAKILRTWKTVGTGTLVYHVEVQLPDGSTTKWKSSRAPEWWGWIS